VFERMGISPAIAAPLVQQAPERMMFQSMLFSRIVPNCRRLGLLDANGGWLRDRFVELGVIAFEHWEDPEHEAMFALAEGVDPGTGQPPGTGG
jgi:hypothetical protein